MAGPFFIPDVSSWQGNLPDFSASAARPEIVGFIIKTSQGLGPGVSPERGHALSWFSDNWPRVMAAGGDRYGTSWFRGCYHFATPASSGTAQADYMLAAVDRAGGWAHGDLPPAWDLEGKAWTSSQQIIDVSSQFAERIYAQLGRKPILYTGSVWRNFGVTDQAGFGSLWTPHMDLMARFGWPNENVMLHQYVGTGKYWNPSGEAAQLGYPTGVSGIDGADMNVVLDGGVPATSIESVRAILTGRGGPAARGGVSKPLLIAVAGLVAIGIAIAVASRDDAT